MLCISIAGGVLLSLHVGIEAQEARCLGQRHGGYTRLLCALGVFGAPSPLASFLEQILTFVFDEHSFDLHFGSYQGFAE